MNRNHLFPMAALIIFCLTPFKMSLADDAVAAATHDGQHPVGGPWGVEFAGTTDPSLPRVLLVGDSILGGYKKEVVQSLKGKANIDAWKTPLWLGKDLFTKTQALLKSEHYDVIHFNEAGLHAWAPGRIPEGQYDPLMQQYVALLKSAAPSAKIIWASTTPVTVAGHPGELDDLDKLISERNALCEPIMRQNGIAIDDLHALMMEHLNLAVGDRWHWNGEGFHLLAQAVSDSVSRALVK